MDENYIPRNEIEERILKMIQARKESAQLLYSHVKDDPDTETLQLVLSAAIVACEELQVDIRTRDFSLLREMESAS